MLPDSATKQEQYIRELRQCRDEMLRQLPVLFPFEIQRKFAEALINHGIELEIADVVSKMPSYARRKYQISQAHRRAWQKKNQNKK